MDKFLAWITPVAPGEVDNTLPGGPVYPDHGLPKPPTGEYPDIGLPGEGGERPSNPIVLPPGAIAPGWPTHPIFLPGAPDNTLPGKPGHKPKPPKPDNTLPGGKPPKPDNTLPGDQPEIDNTLPEGERPVDPGYDRPIIVFPPGLPDNGLPVTPGLPPLVPENPIVLPEGLPPGTALVIPLYGAQLPTPKEGPPGTIPCLVWQGPGTYPVVAYFPPLPKPKK